VPTTRRVLLRGMGATVAVAAVGGSTANVGLINSGTGFVDHFRQMRRTLADNDNLFGARSVITVAADQLDRMRGFNGNLRAAALRDSFQVQTEFADLLGWLHQDLGDHASAQYWLGRALEFAHMSGSPESVAFILARKSQLSADMRDSIGAVLSGEAGIKFGSTNSRIAAISATQAAHGHALAGDAYKCEQTYELACELLVGHEGDESPWGQFFGLSYLEVYRAHSHAVLGDWQTAAKNYETAVRTVSPEFRRDRGVYSAHQAHAYAKSGDYDRAAALGVQALAVNTETGSARGMRELLALWTTLTASDSTSARTFCSAMTDFTAEAAKQEGVE